MRQWAKATECTICGDDLPEGRLLTCSRDCYIEYKYRKEKDRRIAIGKHGKPNIVCKNCGTPLYVRFNPSHKKTMHIVRYRPMYCCQACKEQHIEKLERWYYGS